MTDATELRRLAEAATPGPWLVTRQKFVCLVSDVEYYVTTVDAGDRTICDAQTRPNDCAYIAAMHPQTTLALLDEIAELRGAVITFCGPWAVEYAQKMGLPPRHLHAAHYDLLEKCGARMVDFVRHDNEQ